MIKNTQFIYVCEDCETAYYNSIAAKCCCINTYSKDSLSKYVCSGKKNGVRMVIKKNKAALMEKI